MHTEVPSETADYSVLWSVGFTLPTCSSDYHILLSALIIAELEITNTEDICNDTKIPHQPRKRQHRKPSTS